MDRVDAITLACDEIGPAVSLPDSVIEAAADRATTSGDEVDLWLLCAEICGVMARRVTATGAITRWEGDGAVVVRDAADWAAAERMYRAKSAGVYDIDFAWIVGP